MDPLLAFVITLALITLVSIRYRISPFFTLIGGSILFGLLAGLTLDATMVGIAAGIGNVFSAFGIIILCGAVIAKLLQEQHQIEEMVADIRRHVKNPPVIAGVSGYLLAVLITCCITAYILLNPILDSFATDPKKRNVLLYLAAVGSIISYALVYPTPVVIPLFDTFSDGMSPLVFDAITIPLSLVALAGILLFFRWWCADGMHGGKTETSVNNPTSAVKCRSTRSGPLAGMGSLHSNRGIHPDRALRPQPVAHEHDQFHYAHRDSHGSCPCTANCPFSGIVTGS